MSIILETLEEKVSEDDKEFLQYLRRTIETSEDKKQEFFTRLYMATLFSNVIKKFGSDSKKEDKMIYIETGKDENHEEEVKEYIKNYKLESKFGKDAYYNIVKILFFLEGEFTLDEIINMDINILNKLIKTREKHIKEVIKQNKIEKLLEEITNNCDTKKDKIKVHIIEKNILSINKRNIEDSIELWDKFDNEECCKWFTKKYPKGIITYTETYDYPDDKGVYLECFYNQPIKLQFKI